MISTKKMKKYQLFSQLALMKVCETRSVIWLIEKVVIYNEVLEAESRRQGLCLKYVTFIVKRIRLAAGGPLGLQQQLLGNRPS